MASYLRNPGYGLFFDPVRNHDGWLQPTPLSEQAATSADEFARILDAPVSRQVLTKTRLPRSWKLILMRSKPFEIRLSVRVLKYQTRLRRSKREVVRRKHSRIV